MKEHILKLRNEGKTYNEIKDLIGCSISTISYYCGKGQKEKTLNRTRKRRSGKPLYDSIKNFKYRKCFTNKSRDFNRRHHQGDLGKGLNKQSEHNFTYDDVMDKLGNDPKCYLTGESIDFNKPKSYAFDHILPVSKGGDNSLENLGLCSKISNMSKTDMTLEEYLDQCKKVLINFGYEVKKPE